MKEDVKYYGIYRGVVLDNNDTGIEEPDTSSSGKNKGFGRCKIFFEGIYPDKFKEAMGKMLPWAEPIFPIFGGNAYNDGQKQIDAKFVASAVAAANSCFNASVAFVKSGTPKTVWIENCVKNMNIHITPIQVKNCIAQILKTSGEDSKNSLKFCQNVFFSESIVTVSVFLLF